MRKYQVSRINSESTLAYSTGFESLVSQTKDLKSWHLQLPCSTFSI